MHLESPGGLEVYGRFFHSPCKSKLGKSRIFFLRADIIQNEFQFKRRNKDFLNHGDYTASDQGNTETIFP